MSKQATSAVQIVTTGAMWLGIFLMLFGVYIGVRHPIKVPDKTQELLDHLYLLAQSKINNLMFELVKSDGYQYLSEHMRKGLIERFYNRLLKLVGSDD